MAIDNHNPFGRADTCDCDKRCPTCGKLKAAPTWRNGFVSPPNRWNTISCSLPVFYQS